MQESSGLLRTVGILGAGRVGMAVARQALEVGLDVNIATAKPAEEIELMVRIIAPGASPVNAAQLADADLIVLAVPLHKYRSLDPSVLAGKIVIDAMNYWAPIDGEINEFENDARSTSEIIQAFLPGSRVVKTLNHIGYHELESDGLPYGSHNRRALALAGDDGAAKRLVGEFINRLGYDPFDAGSLAAGRVFQPGTEIFRGSHTHSEIELLAADAQLIHA